VRFCEIYAGVLSRSLIVDQANSAAPSVILSAALVPPQPTESDGALDTGAEPLATAESRQKWLIDAFEEDTAILHRFDAVRCLDDPARGQDRRRGAARRISCCHRDLECALLQCMSPFVAQTGCSRPGSKVAFLSCRSLMRGIL
jgi:hypothetical protein